MFDLYFDRIYIPMLLIWIVIIIVARFNKIYAEEIHYFSETGFSSFYHFFYVQQVKCQEFYKKKWSVDTILSRENVSPSQSRYLVLSKCLLKLMGSLRSFSFLFLSLQYLSHLFLLSQTSSRKVGTLLTLTETSRIVDPCPHVFKL